MLSSNLHVLYAALGPDAPLARTLIREATSTSISLLADLALDHNHAQEPYWRTVRNILHVLERFAHDERCTYPPEFLKTHWSQRLTASQSVSLEPLDVCVYLDAFFRPHCVVLRVDLLPGFRSPKTISVSRNLLFASSRLRLRLARRLDRFARRKFAQLR